jgi:transcriptional regulator with XRE-family HTH domain
LTHQPVAAFHCEVTINVDFLYFPAYRGPDMKKVPNAIDREIGKRIKSRRLFLQRNQQFLADTIGVSYQQVQKYENGTDRVGASRLYAISMALDVPISYFFESELQPAFGDASDRELERQTVNRTVATDEGRSLILSFGRIRDPELRAKVLDLADLLSGVKLSPRPRSSTK